MTLGALGLALALLWELAGPSHAVHTADLTVCPAGFPMCNYTTIQDAVDAADDGDIVKVATGVYTDVHQRAGATQTVYVTKTVTIRGGYSTDFIKWDPDTYSTTLDAMGQGRVFYISGRISPTIEGLRITGGNASGLDGGGLYVLSASATINNNLVFSNTASRGGGLFLLDSKSTLQDNTILSNEATTRGGGLFLKNSASTLRGNTILSNTATTRGGGLFLTRSAARLGENIIRRNRADSGGGLNLNHSDATLINNIVVENQADSVGSGLAIGSSSPRLIHTTLARNRGSDGSGIAVLPTKPGEQSTVLLTNTILVSHTVALTIAAGNTATLEATLWGTATWGNKVDWDGAGTIVTGTVNLRDAPAFVDPDAGDYHVGEDSAARNNGLDAGITIDIDGQPRPYGAGYDIGADEFHPTFYVYLPLAMQRYSGIPDLLILDQNEIERDWDWLRENFGGVEISRTVPGSAYRACILKEVEGPATLVVKVSQDDESLTGLTVIRYWPDANPLPPELVDWYDRGDIGLTDAKGEVGFGMGFGDYYFPPGAGLSSVWVSDPDFPSDLVSGLGMLGGTNHIHLDVQFCLIR